ncbi:hypothetical protein LJC52_03500 [Bacteroidales bacterium OttesenSCG-928-A17]|nr:hypothetical protein [Bacteroidales bacterium OttesenSCG-928-A17]
MGNNVYDLNLKVDWKLINIISQIDRFDSQWTAIERKEGQSLKQELYSTCGRNHPVEQACPNSGNKTTSGYFFLPCMRKDTENQIQYRTLYYICRRVVQQAQAACCNAGCEH